MTAAIVKDVILAALFGAVSFGVMTLKDISGDITAIKIMIATDSTTTAASARRIDRLEAKVYGP